MTAPWIDKGCTKCNLHSGAKTVCVPPRGALTAPILLAGEAPGKQENQDGIVFCGKTGNKLADLLDRAAYQKGQYRITNVVRCIPWEGSDHTWKNGRVRRPSQDEIDACSEYLSAEVVLIKPKVIVAMGNTASQAILGMKSIGAIRGRKQTRKFSYRGREHECFVIPTYHPAMFLYNPDMRMEANVIADLVLAHNIVFREAPKVDYRILNDKESVAKFCASLLAAYRKGKIFHVSCDIESDDRHSGGGPNPWGVETNIMTIQFSWKKSSGVLIPILHPESAFKSREGVEFLRKCLQPIFNEVPISGQNFRFDASYLYMRMGIEVPRLSFDTRSAHHFLHGGSLSSDLDFMSSNYLHETGYKADMKSEMSKLAPSERHFGNVPLSRLVSYAVGDTDFTFQLTNMFRYQLKKEGRLEAYENIYMFPWKFYLDMEINGAQVIPQQYRRLRKLYVPLLQKYLDDIKESEIWPLFRKVARVANPKRFRKPRKRKQTRRKAECMVCGNTWRINLGTKRQKKGETFYVDVPYPDECPICKSVTEHIRTFIIDNPPDPESWWGFDQIEDEEQPKWLYPSDPPLGSSKKVATLIYNAWGCPPVENPKKPYSTDKAALKAASDNLLKRDLKVEYEALQLIREFRRESKVYSSYLKNLPSHVGVKDLMRQTTDMETQDFENTPGLWRVHYGFNTDSVRTGRISSAFHLLPKKSDVKAMYGSRWVDWEKRGKKYYAVNQRGLILAADYSQAEVRVMASESGDEHLIKAFERGDDIHTFVATMVFGKPAEEITKMERQVAKATTFALLYGGDEYTIYEHSRKGQEGLFYDLTVEKCQKVIRDYFNVFPGILRYMKRMIAFAQKYGYCQTRTLFRRPLPDILSKYTPARAKAERVATNAPIQGGASHLCQDSLARCHYAMRELALKSVIFGFVHDSGEFDTLASELPSLFEIVPREMVDKLPIRFPWLKVPFVADFELGRSWREAFGIEIISGTSFKIPKGNADYVKQVIDILKRSWRLKGNIEVQEEESEGKKIKFASGLVIMNSLIDAKVVA